MAERAQNARRFCRQRVCRSFLASGTDAASAMADGKRVRCINGWNSAREGEAAEQQMKDER
jgi:hypothetical protein